MKSFVLCNLLLPVAGEAAGLITQAMGTTGQIFMSAGKSVVDKAMATKKKFGQSCKLRDCEDPWICWKGKCQECQPGDDIIGLTCPLPKQCMRIAQAPFKFYMGCNDPATYIDCGGHVAKTCSECAQNNTSEQFCNGDCEWKPTSGTASGCVAKATTIAPLYKTEKGTVDCGSTELLDDRDKCNAKNRDCYWWTSNVEKSPPKCRSLKELRESQEIRAKKQKNLIMGNYMDSDVEAEDAEKGVCDMTKYSWYKYLKTKPNPFNLGKLKKECGNIKAGQCIWKGRKCVPTQEGDREAVSKCGHLTVAGDAGCICISKSTRRSSITCKKGSMCTQGSFLKKTRCTEPKPCSEIKGDDVGKIRTFEKALPTACKCGEAHCNLGDKICRTDTNTCSGTSAEALAGAVVGMFNTAQVAADGTNKGDQSAVRNEHNNELKSNRNDDLHHSHNDHHDDHTSGSQSEHSTEQGQNPPQKPERVEIEAPSPDVQQSSVNALANQPQALQAASSPSNNSDGGSESSVDVVDSSGGGDGVLKENGSLMPVSRHNI